MTTIQSLICIAVIALGAILYYRSVNRPYTGNVDPSELRDPEQSDTNA